MAAAGSHVETLLADAAARLGDRLVLWKGSELGGSDIDLLALDGAERELGVIAQARGLRRAPGDPGHVVWAWPDGDGPEIDAMLPAAWPSAYPPLAGLRERLVPAGPKLPPMPSGADRLVMLAADALAGRPSEKIARRVRAALAEPGALERARQIAPDPRLLELVADPDALEARSVRGRLPWTPALAAAARSPAARAALRLRVAGAVDARRSGRPVVVALSGMDGAGKSTASAIVERLAREHGRRCEHVWIRPADSDAELLDRISRPMRRILRRGRQVADPAAVLGGDAAKASVGTAEPRGRDPVAWAWVLVVAATAALRMRQAVRRAGAGAVLVGDRWRLDAVIDLRVRYGRHGAAERLLRLVAPRADVEILLELDAATALARKPDDQPLAMLERMETLYAEEAGRLRPRRIAAARPVREVQLEIEAAVRPLLEAG